MTRIVLIMTLLLGGMLVSAFYPIYLPVEMLNAIDEVFLTLLSFDGLLPIATLLSALSYIFAVEVGIMLYKFGKWVLG